MRKECPSWMMEDKKFIDALLAGGGNLSDFCECFAVRFVTQLNDAVHENDPMASVSANLRLPKSFVLPFRSLMLADHPHKNDGLKPFAFAGPTCPPPLPPPWSRLASRRRRLHQCPQDNDDQNAANDVIGNCHGASSPSQTEA